MRIGNAWIMAAGLLISTKVFSYDIGLVPLHKFSEQEGKRFGQNISLLQARLEFTEEYANTLTEGAGKRSRLPHKQPNAYSENQQPLQRGYEPGERKYAEGKENHDANRRTSQHENDPAPQKATLSSFGPRLQERLQEHRAEEEECAESCHR